MKGFPTVRRLAAGVVAAFCVAASAFGASDYLLEIDGVPGESIDPVHPGAIAVSAFSFDVLGQQSAGRGGGGGGGAGKVNVSDISFTKSFDKASPVLMMACANGQHIKEAKLTCRKAGGGQQEYLVIKMENVLISSVSPAGSSADDLPSESLSLNFTKIEFTYLFPDPTGAAGQEVKFSWNLKENKK
jgi:type VI secretion system secreted protein Hcp